MLSFGLKAGSSPKKTTSRALYCAYETDKMEIEFAIGFLKFFKFFFDGVWSQKLALGIGKQLLEHCTVLRRPSDYPTGTEKP